MRSVGLFEGRMKWRREFCAALPVFIMIEQGVLTIRRAGNTRMAVRGDVVLLTPGSFEITAVPMSAYGLVRFQYAKIPISALGRLLSAGSAIEEVALYGVRHEEHTGIHICKGMRPQVARNLQIPMLQSTPVKSVMNALIVSLSPAVFPFLRRVYYERRWAFLGMMEAHTLEPRPVEFLADSYADGRAAFFRDCRLYTGHTPRAWFDRRKMQLAEVWLHVAKHTIADVAARLHYRVVKLFRAEYENHFRRPPETAGCWSEGASLSLDHPFCCLRPFWWPAPLPLAGAGTWSRLWSDRFSDPIEESSEPVDASAMPAQAPEPVNATADQSEELPQEAASGLPPEVDAVLPVGIAGEKEPERKSIGARLCNGELIPITEIIDFPAGLPELLKAA